MISRDNIRMWYYALCVKYRETIREEEAWDIDPILGAAFKEYNKQLTTNLSCNHSFAQENVSRHGNDLEILLNELHILKERLRDAGISITEAINMIAEKAIVCPMFISVEQCRILIPDLGVCIQLTPLQMAIYILVINHDEGILAKEIYDYKKELTDLIHTTCSSAICISPRYTKGIERITDISTGALYENISRIKCIFTKAISQENIARYYYITTIRSKRMRVLLPRELIKISKTNQLPNSMQTKKQLS